MVARGGGGCGARGALVRAVVLLPLLPPQARAAHRCARAGAVDAAKGGAAPPSSAYGSLPPTYASELAAEYSQAQRRPVPAPRPFEVESAYGPATPPSAALAAAAAAGLAAAAEAERSWPLSRVQAPPPLGGAVVVNPNPVVVQLPPSPAQLPYTPPPPPVGFGGGVAPPIDLGVSPAGRLAPRGLPIPPSPLPPSRGLAPVRFGASPGGSGRFGASPGIAEGSARLRQPAFAPTLAEGSGAGRLPPALPFSIEPPSPLPPISR